MTETRGRVVAVVVVAGVVGIVLAFNGVSHNNPFVAVLGYLLVIPLLLLIVAVQLYFLLIIAYAFVVGVIDMIIHPFGDDPNRHHEMHYPPK